jgi:hypothetical protein
VASLVVVVVIDVVVGAELVVRTAAEAVGINVVVEVVELVVTAPEVVGADVVIDVRAVVASEALHHVPEQTPQFAAD